MIILINVAKTNINLALPYGYNIDFKVFHFKYSLNMLSIHD